MITRTARREIDIHTFLSDMNKCTGKVFLETKTGDHFDLRSVFSRYILAAVIQNGMLPDDATYTFEEEDLAILSPYLD